MHATMHAPDHIAPLAQAPAPGAGACIASPKTTITKKG
jgi:hypothetical protein